MATLRSITIQCFADVYNAGPACCLLRNECITALCLYVEETSSFWSSPVRFLLLWEVAGHSCFNDGILWRVQMPDAIMVDSIVTPRERIKHHQNGTMETSVANLSKLSSDHLEFRTDVISWWYILSTADFFLFLSSLLFFHVFEGSSYFQLETLTWLNIVFAAILQGLLYFLTRNHTLSRSNSMRIQEIQASKFKVHVLYSVSCVSFQLEIIYVAAVMVVWSLKL